MSSNAIKNTKNGFMLLEMIVFIIVVGLAVSASLLSLQIILQRSPSASRQTIAIGLAQERMELILGQKRLNGFNNFSDLCYLASPPSICTSLSSDYNVSSLISTFTIAGDSQYKIITVTVSGVGNAVLSLLVGS